MPRRSALVLVLSLLCWLSAFGEPAAPAVLSPSQVQHTPIPLDHLYRHFLDYQTYLDKRAIELDQQGQRRSAAYHRQHLQTSLHFTNAQMAAIREAVGRMQADTANMWTKARPIIDQDHEWLKLNGRNAGHPPGHAVVDGMQKENEAAFKQTIAKLNRKLGPIATARLQAHLKSEIAPHVTIQKFPTALVPDSKIDFNAARNGRWEVRQ